MEWFDNLFKDSTDTDYLINPKTEAGLISRISTMFNITLVLSFCFTHLLYYMRDRFLPQSFVDLSNYFKNGIYFDRYQHLIDQGGLAFADRFFIAYGLILATNVFVLMTFMPIVCVIVRREMKPVRHVSKIMKRYWALHILAVILLAYGVLSMGGYTDQTGVFRAEDSYITLMLLVMGTLAPSSFIFVFFSLIKSVYVAHDAWRDGIFREVFFSKN